MRIHLARRMGVLLLIVGILLASVPAAWGQSDETVTVMSVRAPIHVEPSAPSETVVNVTAGTLLYFFGFDETLNWAQVETFDGTAGWISTSHIRLNGPYVPEAGELLVNAVDGSADDWGRFTRAYMDESGDSTGMIDIQAVRSFINENYLYILIEAEGPLNNARLLLVDIVTNVDGIYSTYQYAQPLNRAGTMFVVTEESGESRDASGVLEARDTAFELRIPLDILDSPPALNIVSVKVQEAGDGGLVTTDELNEVMPAVVTLEDEPAPNATSSADDRVNLRAAPVNGEIIAVLATETPLALLGASADGEWLYVRQENTLTGWVFAELVDFTTALEDLPVIE